LSLSRSSFLSTAVLCLGITLAVPARPAFALHAASAAAAPADASNSPSYGNAGKVQKEESGDDVYRHSASVRLLGKWLHLDEEAAAKVFEYLNFAILAGAILFYLLKNLPKAFRANRKEIERQLVDARTATKQAQERLAAIEERLRRLDQEIAAISKQADEDSIADEARIKASMEAERQRIVDAATKDIAAAGSAAQRDLRRFAASLAIERATQRLVLSGDDDRFLMQEFTQKLSHQAQSGGKN
jgi:F-type H+-transporting ATPase subunit b